MIERKARIFNIQKYNMYDGPGVRTLVFFKGCPLRCQWCSNPEGQLRTPQLLFKKDSCVNCGACVEVCPQGIHTLDAAGKHQINRKLECIGCRKCEDACNQDAIAIMGEEKPISELIEVIEEDRPFYDVSGGGITLGGGEVLMQPEAACCVLQACKQRGINTAIETCGYARPEAVAKVADFVDLFLYDVKTMNSDRHYELTGVRNETILQNLKWLLENRYNVKIRMPLLKKVNDSEAEIDALIQFLMPYQDMKNFKGIDLLPYHKMGVNKYNQLDWEYPVEGDPALTDEDLGRIENCIKRYDFPVSVVRH
ncbi:choline TMA-lyase-activating enzyme [Desulfobaculum bizertense]|uniref:Pyruvate formate lyase activating enzyme n=1 Tax=Desulfobaculum bizertense DSM 18034 TaxID=1121442 RepID=A0A1T4W4L1_9BACT|nr:choline TMA-lyase-activating enzyme [Desulfobaculum bizertense]UIJ38665.1 choline TMA-lyase-activating enzyme [Desulfobaculum bizertense]SKA72210.1 pyruvate formate lyase activating enzyme [Desulfobaculum bizertense DSM 18034]